MQAYTTGHAQKGKSEHGIEGMELDQETADKLSKQGADLMKEARQKGTLFKQKLRGKETPEDTTSAAAQVQAGLASTKKDSDLAELAEMGKKMMEEAHRKGAEFKRKAEPMMKGHKHNKKKVEQPAQE
eukprot:9032-Heterococcus_DN1.PRE.2